MSCEIEVSDAMCDAALFSEARDDNGEDVAMLIDLMGMGVHEKVDFARLVIRVAIQEALRAA